MHTFLSIGYEFSNICKFDYILTCIFLFAQAEIFRKSEKPLFSLMWSVSWLSLPIWVISYLWELVCYSFSQSLGFYFTQVSNALLYCIFNQSLDDSFIQHGVIKHPQSMKNRAQWGGSFFFTLIALLLNISLHFLLNFDVESFLFYFAFPNFLNIGILMHRIGYMSFGKSERTKQDQNESEKSD